MVHAQYSGQLPNESSVYHVPKPLLAAIVHAMTTLPKKSENKLSTKNPFLRALHFTMNCNSERNRIEYLQNVVFGHPWALDACGRAIVGLISSQELYRQLEAEVQMSQKEKIGRM